MYIHNLPYGINSYAKPVIYSDDKTMLITANNLNDLQTKLNPTLNYVTTWILVTGLSLYIKRQIQLNLAQTISKMITSKLLIKIKL